MPNGGVTELVGLRPDTIYRQAVERGFPVSHWHGKPNGFRLPTGKEPGMGYILLPYSDIIKLNLSNLHTLQFTYDITTIGIERLTVVSAEALYPTQTVTNTTPFLVTLADTRLFLKRTSINTGYNVLIQPGDETAPIVASSYVSNTLNSGSPWTWQEVVEDIWSLFPAATAGLLDTTGVTWPSDTPYNLCFYGMSAWDALFHVLEKIGLILAIRRSGTYALYNEDAADDVPPAVFANAHTYLSDQTLHQIPNTIQYPETVEVYFSNLGDLRPIYVSSVLTTSILPLVTPRAGVTDIIRHDAVAVYDSSGLITNSAALDAIALARVTDYLNGLQRSFDTRLYHTLVVLNPNSKYDFVEWFDHGYGLFTQVHASLKRLPSPVCTDCPETFSLDDCRVIRFQIVSADPTTRTALVEILARPYGCGINDIPDTLAGGTVAEVEDPCGCFFNEPNEELTGRCGWARYMSASYGGQWEVFSLCCAFPDCNTLETPLS